MGIYIEPPKSWKWWMNEAICPFLNFLKIKESSQKKLQKECKINNYMNYISHTALSLIASGSQLLHFSICE